jgi:hydrogenase nickel insertion protein HypA
MHEFSIANPIVKKVLDLAKEKKAKKVKSIEISIGELVLLGAEEEFIFWLRELLNKEEITKDVKIRINTVKAAVECNKCGYEGNLKLKHEHSHSHPVFLCPNCEESDICIKEGRDCVIKKVQVQI